MLQFDTKLIELLTRFFLVVLQFEPSALQGRVRTKTVKKASRVVIEKYYPRLTLDFQTNKRICDEVALIPTKRLRNKIAGFTTHLMRRIQKGPVRGISFKLQEEERERRDNWVPDVSAINTESIEIDTDTKELLNSLNLGNLSGVSVITAAAPEQKNFRREGGNREGGHRDGNREGKREGGNREGGKQRQ